MILIFTIVTLLHLDTPVDLASNVRDLNHLASRNQSRQAILQFLESLIVTISRAYCNNRKAAKHYFHLSDEGDKESVISVAAVKDCCSTEVVFTRSESCVTNAYIIQ